MTTNKPDAIVTGGTRGIGLAICTKLAENGYNIAFTYKSSDEQAQAVVALLTNKGVKAKAYKVDQADAAQVTSAFEQIQKDFTNITVLVNNAGISIDGLSMRFKVEDFDKLMNTNVRGAFLATQAVMRPMMKNRSGSIIFISSVIGQMGNGGQTVYASSKAALFGMMKSFAKEVGSRNIRVNAIAPGFIKTDMTDGLPQESKDAILSTIPLGNLGNPEDIANAVVFLAGPGSSYITGQVLAVNGGMYV